MVVSGAKINLFDSREALADALSTEVASYLQSALQTRGEALLVVSGGSTPIPFFEALSRANLDWQKVTLLLADERWVPADHADSNEQMLCAYLLQHAAQAARFISLAPLAGEALQEGVCRIDEQLRGLSVPDVTVLGMGEDGHTASLFPRHPSLQEGMQSDARAIAVRDAPKPPAQRVSLSAKMLAQSNQLFVHITGDAKLEVMKAENSEHPITQMLRASSTQPSLFWSE